MAIEIVDLPIDSMVICPSYDSYVNVYQRVKENNPLSVRWLLWLPKQDSLVLRCTAATGKQSMAKLGRMLIWHQSLRSWWT
jgi:hypothetical protein